MQSWAQDPDRDAADREREEAEKEKKAEEDDPDTLKQARDWDEYKDGKQACVAVYSSLFIRNPLIRNFRL